MAGSRLIVTTLVDYLSNDWEVAGVGMGVNCSAAASPRILVCPGDDEREA